MKDTLEKWLNYLSLGMSEEDVIKEMVKTVHSHYKSDMLTLFLNINELDKKVLEKEKSILYEGLQSSLGNQGMICKHLLEDKTSIQAKDMVKYKLEKDNIAFIIAECKAYFPTGKPNGASYATKWILDKFIDILRNHKSKYVEGGDSYSWSINMGHKEYIDLIIKEYDL